MPYVNRLYLAVIPLVHLDTGMTEQTMTLFPDENFATHFRRSEVDRYVNFFKARAESYLKGPYTHWEFQTEPIHGTDLLRVTVIQHVSQ